MAEVEQTQPGVLRAGAATIRGEATVSYLVNIGLWLGAPMLVLGSAFDIYAWRILPAVSIVPAFVVNWLYLLGGIFAGSKIAQIAVLRRIRR